ncbi:MAG: hypothetical protein HC767_08355 [Akkermansiaceae bacterium]|nr:hypothetical protein [Akkermansiaceae bacterium]
MKNQYIFPGLFVLFSSSMAMSKVIPNHTAADLVLGQADFVSNNAMPVPPSATTMNQPYSVAVDPVTRKVFVADRGNSPSLTIWKCRKSNKWGSGRSSHWQDGPNNKFCCCSIRLRYFSS